VPNVMGVLRAEIRRLARKETKEAVRDLKRQVTALRRRLAATKKRIGDVERTAQRAGSSRAAAPARGEAGGGDGGQIRFSPRWVKVHRAKLGMSRRVYAKLVGVSPQTILLWETNKARPRRATLATWRSLRGRGIRELKAAVGGEAGRKRGPKPGRKARAAARKAAPKRRRAAARKKAGRPARGARRAAPKARRAKAAPKRRRATRGGRAKKK